MLSTVSSLISKTIDVFLKINSAEGRRRRFGKDIFEVYKALDEIVKALQDIEELVEGLALIDQAAWNLGRPLPGVRVVGSLSSDGTIEVQTLQPSNQGIEMASPPHKVQCRDLLPMAMTDSLRRLSDAIARLSEIMAAESWDLFQVTNQPDKLRALGIYDPVLVETFVRAWLDDGGFVEALHSFRLDSEVDGRVLRLRDAEFHPGSRVHGYKVKGVRTTYSLDSKRDARKFLRIARSTRKNVVAARDAVQAYLSTNVSIEDVL